MPLASHRLTRPLLAWAVVLTALGPAPAGAADAVGGCVEPLLDRAARGSEVRATSPEDLAAAARVNGLTPRDLAAEVAADRTLWLDRCGRAFHVEPADPARPAPAEAVDAPAAVTTDTGPPSEALDLESRPGAARTIYLDFTGGTVTGTGWNDTYATPSMTVAPYSMTAPADTAFSDAELTEIQRAWQVVAEDFAPFDVNVTTTPPAAGAIERSGPGDMTYGTRVRVTGGGTIYDSCRCGGLAYVDVFDVTQDHEYFQPAWVFTSGTSTSGRRIGEAASHEAGHTLGLGHDGIGTSAYYSGTPPWAPIMGSSYNQPVSQWSAGEYTNATSTEDDVAIIAARLGVITDDHADVPLGATRLAATPRDGVITTRTDTDAFAFPAAGATSVTVTPAPGYPDLDIGLRILDSSGTVVASVDPPVARVGPGAATGLDAVWSATLPGPPTTYTAIIDGVGSGDPSTAGSYSDYASLGRYRITLATEAPIGTVLTTTPITLAPGTVGVGYSATAATATGGTAPYAWSSTGLPSGLTIDPVTATVSGTPAAAGSYRVRLTATDVDGATATADVILSVSPAAVALPPRDPEPTVVPAPPPPGASAVPERRFAFATSAHLRAGHVGHRYRARISTLDAIGAVSWRRSSAVPPGLRLVRGGPGRVVLTGRPSRTGRWLIRLVATDAAGVRIARRFSLRVRP